MNVETGSRCELYLGLISGTSMDAVDAALVQVTASSVHTIATSSTPYPVALRSRLFRAIAPECRLSLHDFALLDHEVGASFARAARDLLRSTHTPVQAVRAIGSHGQTLRHAGRAQPAYTMQIGNPALIAARLGLLTVADFRRADIAYGGEGAPLVPAFHAAVFSDTERSRAVLNIGGIANVTVIPCGSPTPVFGFDTGPGNCLLDDWIHLHQQRTFDEDGRWAASGTVNSTLLASMLEDPYFRQPAPKSTGREIFNREFVRRHIDATLTSEPAAADVQATLVELTVESIARALEALPSIQIGEVLACGGGTRNTYLQYRLRTRFAPLPLRSTADLGIDPDFVEAATFAWLAFKRLHDQPVILTTTSTPREVLLGALYAPTADQHPALD